MSCKDPYACGPQCSCDPCDKPRPLEVVVTAGPPQGEPNPCDNLPIAYDATNGCFYLWEENTGWFEASGISFEVADTDPNGTGDRLILTKCGENTVFFNSRNTAIRLEHRGTSDNDGAEWLVLEQTHGPDVEVNLSDLDSYVTALSLNNGNHVLTLTQNQGKPNQTVNLTYLKQTETDNTITGDGTADDPLSVNWNRLCADTEVTPVLPEDATVLFCTAGGIGKAPLPPVDLAGCIDGNFPDIGELCGDPLYLVLVDDGGCSRIATYSPTGSAARYVGTFSDAQPQLPQGQTDLVIPAVFTDPTQFYRWNDLVADDNEGAGTIDEAKLQNSKLTRVEFDLECRQRLTSDTYLTLVNPTDVQDAYSQRMRVLYRYRTDGGPWVYNRIQATNRIATGLPINAIGSDGHVWSENPRLYGPGHIEVETFYIGDGSSVNPVPLVELKANTHPAGSGFVPFPRTHMGPSL